MDVSSHNSQAHNTLFRALCNGILEYACNDAGKLCRTVASTSPRPQGRGEGTMPATEAARTSRARCAQTLHCVSSANLKTNSTKHQLDHLRLCATMRSFNPDERREGDNYPCTSAKSCRDSMKVWRLGRRSHVRYGRSGTRDAADIA